MAAGLHDLLVGRAGLDDLLLRLTAEGIEHEPVETYVDGMRHVKVPDPDGNAIAFVGLPVEA